MDVTDIKKVAVFGAGTMGPGLALVFTLCGYEVSLYSRKQETLDKAVATAKDALSTLVAHGSISLADADRARLSAYNGLGPWWTAGPGHMNQAVPIRLLRRWGLVIFLEAHQRLSYSS